MELNDEQRAALKAVFEADLALADDLRETLETMPPSIRRLFEKQEDDA